MRRRAGEGERRNLGEPVAVDTAVWLPEGRDTKRLREERREIAGGGGVCGGQGKSFWRGRREGEYIYIV